MTIPGVAIKLGATHILTQTIADICSIFEKLGFLVMEGPEIETEFNNFSALNIPVDHPSRDAFDTFYIDSKDPSRKDRYLLLRSHTSPAQIRIMKEHKPPLAFVVPGKVHGGIHLVYCPVVLHYSAVVRQWMTGSFECVRQLKNC